MTDKLIRVTNKIFAETATLEEIGQFGSGVVGSKLETTDVATIQALSAWFTGWSKALVSGNRYATMQELNGILKVLSYQSAYQFQEGISEYDSATTYYIGSIVKKTGTFELYGSLTDTNIGNALTDDTKWQFLCNLSSLFSILPLGTCTTASSTTDKTANIANFMLYTGSMIQLTFSNANTAITPTLNISSTGAKNIKNLIGGTVSYIPANIKLNFVYDGTNWIALHTNTFSITPNYSKSVSKSWNTLYIADSDGWVFVYVANYESELTINGVTYPITHSSTASNSGSFCMPISKGDTYVASGASVTEYSLSFIPSKGAL